MPLQKGLYPIVAIDNGVQNMTICIIVYYILFCGRCHEQFLLNIFYVPEPFQPQNGHIYKLFSSKKEINSQKSNVLTCSPNCFALVHIASDSTKNFFLTIDFYFSFMVALHHIFSKKVIFLVQLHLLISLWFKVKRLRIYQLEVWFPQGMLSSQAHQLQL